MTITKKLLIVNIVKSFVKSRNLNDDERDEEHNDRCFIVCNPPQNLRHAALHRRTTADATIVISSNIIIIISINIELPHA